MFDMKRIVQVPDVLSKSSKGRTIFTLEDCKDIQSIKKLFQSIQQIDCIIPIVLLGKRFLRPPDEILSRKNSKKE